LLYGLGKKKPHAAGVCITVVKSALKHAIATGAIKGPSALRDVDRADFINRENKKEASVLSLDQLDEVLKQISTWTDYRNKAFMLLLIFYGCRGRELRLTKQSWVGKDRWTIPANAHKTGKGDLIRPVLPEMEHLWDCAREYSGCPTQMFTNYAGKTKPSVDALSRSAVTGIVKTIVLVSGKIKVISPHVFRKTARTHWAGDYVCCEKMLGHTVSAVADIYDRRDWSIEMIPIYRHWFETLRNLDNGHVFDPKFLRR
jgi:integrase